MATQNQNVFLLAHYLNDEKITQRIVNTSSKNFPQGAPPPLSPLPLSSIFFSFSFLDSGALTPFPFLPSSPSASCFSRFFQIFVAPSAAHYAGLKLTLLTSESAIYDGAFTTLFAIFYTR